MRIIKYIFLISLLIFLFNPLFAGGQKDLTEKPEGMGLLVIGNDGKLTAVEGIKWTYEIVYINSSDGLEYSIEIPKLKDKIDFYYLPPGKYKALKSLPHHFSGSEYIDEEGFKITDYDEIKYNFEIKENEITLFNYYLYKFNNKKKSGQDVMGDVEDYVLPKDFISKFGTSNYLYRWDYNPETIQYTWFLTIGADIEKNILKDLLLVEGSDQWLYKPEFEINTAYWPNVPTPEEEIEVIVEVPPWVSPEVPLDGNLYILSIGIDTYNNKELSLSGAGDSALDFTDLISTYEKGNYREIYVNTLTDGYISKDQIIEEVKKISDLTKPEDTTIIFISSHGISDIKGRPFIFPSDGDISNITSTCLPFRTLNSKISKNKGLVLSIMDVGRSGSWLNGREAFFSFNPSNLSLRLNSFDVSVGMYSVSSGIFSNNDLYSFPDILKETTLLNSISSIIDEKLWSSYIINGNPNGLWSSTSQYSEILKERTQLLEKKYDLLVELTVLMNDGKEQEAFLLIKTLEEEQYFLSDFINDLEDSMNQYFDKIENKK